MSRRSTLQNLRELAEESLGEDLPPRNFKSMGETFLRRIRLVKQAAAEFAAFHKKLDRYDYDDLPYEIQEVLDQSQWMGDKDFLDLWAWESMVNNPEGMEIKYLSDNLEHKSRDFERLEGWIDVPGIDRLQRERGDYEEYWPEHTFQLLDRVRQTIPLVQELLRSYEMVKRKMKTQADWNDREYMDAAGRGEPEERRPRELQAKTVIAYHASLNARSLLSKGFDPAYDSREHPDMGLGGGQQVGPDWNRLAISVTVDYAIAQTILRSFKILWEIANGEMKPHQVVRMVRHWADHDPHADKGGTYDFEYIRKRWRDDLPHDIRPHGPKNRRGRFGDHQPVDVDLPTSPQQAIHFFLKSSWFLKAKHLNHNPVFFGADAAKLYSRLKGTPKNSIGILKMEVRADRGKWLWGERELRILPEDVVKIKSLIN